MIPSSHKLLLGTPTGLTKKISDQGLQQRTSRKVESSKQGFCLTGALERCTECNPAMTMFIYVYFPLNRSDHLAIMKPEISNLLSVLLLHQSLLNCSSSFLFLCYHQSNLSRRDITNVTAVSQNKYVKPAISET